MDGKPYDKRTALLIFIEPTPYVLGCIRRIKECHGAPVDVLFLGANISQPWNLSLNGVSAFILPSGMIAAAREIWSRLASRRYGLLHLAGWGYPLVIYALLLARLYDVPVFMESDTPMPAQSPLWKRAIKSVFYPLLFRLPRRLLPAGSRQADYFRHYGAADDRIQPVQMTVDTADIMKRCEDLRAKGSRISLRRSFGLDEGRVVFVYVGRLEPHKGIGTLLAAFEKLVPGHPEALLLIVGDGSVRKKVEAAAALSHSVKYAGRLDQEGVIRAYQCADAAVLPSEIEPWGLVVNEAMAAGLPVIVSDRVGCADDLVRHGETGLVFPAASEEKLYGSMLFLAANGAARVAMGEAGRRLISGWTLERQAELIVRAWHAETTS